MLSNLMNMNEIREIAALCGAPFDICLLNLYLLRWVSQGTPRREDNEKDGRG
jgi:hypothetical protein